MRRPLRDNREFAMRTVFVGGRPPIKQEICSNLAMFSIEVVPPIVNSYLQCENINQFDSYCVLDDERFRISPC
jgi:hypothetical protein